MAVNKLNPSASGIPYGNNAARPANPGIGKPYFNGEAQRLELYTGATYGWQNIVAETPGVTGYTGSVIETNTTNTIAITGTNFASGAQASLIGSDGTEYNAVSTTVNNLTSISATFGSIPGNNEPYDIRVTNPSNLYGIYYDVLTVNDKPIWTTPAGSLGTFNGSVSVSIQLVATDEENNSLTYSLVSGALPSGLTLSSSGLISGTNTTTPGTYTFTIAASDGINTGQQRIFSMTVPYPTVTGGTLTSDSTYYYRTFTGNGNLVISNNSLNADYLIVGGGAAGAGGDGGTGGGGGGAGGLFFQTASTFTANTYSAVVGGGAPGGYVASTNGTNTSFNSKIAYGGGAAANGTVAGYSGGSGGGTGRDSNKAGGVATQPSSATGGYGNDGGAGQASTYAGGAGGGGAGAAGGMGSPTGPAGTGGNPGDYYAGNGGIGYTNALINSMGSATGTGQLSGGNYYYAGGGGGGAFQMVLTNLPTYGQGGIGGGGRGGNGYDNRAGYPGNANYRDSLPGTANTGGGGGGVIGGSGAAYGGGQSGAGGSGVVIVRYTRASVGG